MLKRLLAGIAVALGLVGCTTTEQANDALATKFTGTRTDDFFIRHGPPIAEHTLDDGRKMYLWSEGGQDISLPGQTSGTVTVVGNTAWWNGWSSPGSNIHVECQVRTVSKDGVMQTILAHRDSIGWWRLSRCNEVFGRRAKS